MLSKFETKSSRVKGLSFHPTRPWILCSLNDGSIQLWDYRAGSLLKSFKEHTGPVRSVDFHSSQPLFVSGGDDYKIRVWNYNSERSLYTLVGHKDYIRCVQFHTESPWIVSSSDDQTIRIWNWQSRECVAVLSGHNHYVMSALFHPGLDLIVSASLDQTIRVWDISGLKKQSKSIPGLNSVPGSVMGRLGIESVANVKFVLEGHERGVNWASFHPDLPLIVSGSDDRTIKIWRTNETKAWEVDTLRGHTNNVSCVYFHPRYDLIISDSEDHSIKVWDSTKRVCVQTFLRNRDRFWILATHPSQTLLAAGHDSGAVVFKLRRERIPLAVSSAGCFYLRDHTYRLRELGGKRETTLLQASRGPATMTESARRLEYNVFCPTEHMLLATAAGEEGGYELLRLPMELEKRATPIVVGGAALGACFLSRTKFVTLENPDTLLVRNCENIVTKRVVIPVGGCSRVFAGGRSGRVLLLSGDELCLFDVDAASILGSAVVSGLKRCCWNQEGSRLAVVTKSGVMLLGETMKVLAEVTEKVRVKDALWEKSGVLLYNTMNQLKYLLPSGEGGIVRSLDEPVYLVAVSGRVVKAFTRKGELISFAIDSTEFMLKLYLEQQRYREAIHLIRTMPVDTNCILSYLQRNGYQDIALFFVTDTASRFRLALRCGNIDIAVTAAQELNRPEVWSALAKEAWRQGNHEIVELCYQHMHAFDHLAFLYVVTGDTEKLRKMMRIAELRQDIMNQFQTALFLGDVAARVAILQQTGQTSLAYLTAATNGLAEQAAQLKSQLEEEGLPVPAVAPSASLLTPPIIVNQCANWPLKELPCSQFDKLMREADTVQDTEDVFDSLDAASPKDVEADVPSPENAVDELELSDSVDSAWSDDLDFGSESESPEEPAESLRCGASVVSQWSQSSLAHDAAAAGDVASAARLLQKQLGLARVTSLRSELQNAFLSVQAVAPGFPGCPPLATPVLRSTTPPLPFTSTNLASATVQMKKVLKAFQGAKFGDVVVQARTLLQSVPLCVVNSREEEVELRSYVDYAREYLLAARLDGVKSRGDAATLLESVYLMTRCNLQNSHLLLTLHSAMVAAFKNGNFIDAAGFAQRILSHSDIASPKNASLEAKAKKVLAKSTKEGRNMVTVPSCEGAIESEELVSLGKETKTVSCPFCKAVYRAEKKGSICCVCELSKIGEDTIGLVCVSTKWIVCWKNQSYTVSRYEPTLLMAVSRASASSDKKRGECVLED